MTTSFQFQLNLHNKGINSFDEIIPLLTNISQLKELDLSNNNLTSLPSNLSSFESLIYLNLSHNKFTNYNEIGQSLSTIPTLKELKIDLFTGDDAYYILSNLPNLELLNSKPTKEDQPQSTLDINDKEMDCTSLKNEIPNFNDITKRIISKMQSMNQSTDVFYNQFQSLFKTQIDLLSNLNENIPNYIYASHVLNAKNEIYCFLQNKVLTLLTNNVDVEIVSILKDINNYINTNSKNAISLIGVVAGTFEQSVNEHKVNNIELMKNNEELKNKINHMQNNIDNQNLVTEKLIEENRELNAKCVKYENSYSKQQNTQTKINNQKTHNNNTNNKVHLNDKQNLNTINTNNNNINNNNNALNNSYNLQKGLQHSNSFTVYTNPNNRSAYISNSNADNIYDKGNNQLLSSYKKERNCLIGPINNRTITIKTLLEIINEIYQSKSAADKKSKEIGQQRETLEQHMYTYLNHKYGLKNLIIEWANAIIQGIRKYSKQNSEILLFAKIMRNEIEETQIILITKLKSTVIDYLHYYLQNKYTFKTKGDIDKIVNTIKNGSLNDEEWKSITQYLFQNENDLLLLNEKIDNYIQKNNPNEYKIKYQQFIQMIIEFQIKLRDIYLKNFNTMFKNVDKGRHGVLSINEFLTLMEIIGINNKNRINEYLNILDPYKNGMILYSDVVGLLSTEMIYEKDPETEEVIEMSLMDKIAMQVPENE